MFQALEKGQSCRRARAGPCEELEHRDGIWGAQEQRMGIRAREDGAAEVRKMWGQQPEDGVPWVGG